MDKAQTTRNDILQKAFSMIYEHGYQGTSVDKIIETTQVTKGAFYYHFKNKEAMGIAVIKEVILPRLREGILQPIADGTAPIQTIYTVVETKLMTDSDYAVENGCPTNNLVQEMSPVSARFRATLQGVLDTWINTLDQALQRGMANGLVKADTDTHAAAVFIVSGYEGAKGMGKLFGRKVYKSYLQELKNYLDQLE